MKPDSNQSARFYGTVKIQTFEDYCNEPKILTYHWSNSNIYLQFVSYYLRRLCKNEYNIVYTQTFWIMLSSILPLQDDEKDIIF